MSTTKDASWAKALLKGVGLRATPARVAVMRQLAMAGAPLSHGETVDALAAFGFDQSTVYRSLHELADAKLLSKLDLGDQIRRFELRSSLGGEGLDHPHFMCVDCGKLACLESYSFHLTPNRGRRRAMLGVITEVLLRGQCGACSTG